MTNAMENPPHGWGWVQDQEKPLPKDERARHNALEKKWEALIEQAMPTAAQDVERAVKAWNLKIREQLRNETGFVLRAQDKSAQVRVDVLPGIPRSLAPVLDDQLNTYGPYLLRVNQIRDGAVAAGLISRDAIHAFTLTGKFPPEAPSAESIAQVGALLEAFANKLAAFDLPKRILAINEDVLGAYFFRRSQVGIFWVPIALVAGGKPFPIEALTFVVLAHELAHAYTHVGLDIDRQQWSTDDFARADVVDVEGFAQYYTERICKHFEAAIPSALAVFNELRTLQGAAYNEYAKWEECNSPEELRALLRDKSGRAEAAMQRIAKQSAELV